MKRNFLHKTLAVGLSMTMLLIQPVMSSAASVEADGEGGSALTNYLPEVEEVYAHSATVKHEKITIILAGDPGNLLPQDMQNSGKEMLDSIFERLYIIDGFGGELLPLIAEELPVDNGDGTYDIKIRENIYDSDGNHMTAADVAFSYDWLVTNSTPQNMGKYQSAEAIEDYVVRFHCDTLDGVSDYANLFAQQLIFTEQAFNDNDFTSNPVGTGPYKVESFTPSSEIVLTAVDDYWCEGEDYQLARYRANVQTIDYLILTETSQQANALRTGMADYSDNISETDLPDFTNDGQYAGEFGVYPFLDNGTFYLLPNCSEYSICSDINVRKAIMYAVDGYTCAVASGNSSAEVVYDIYNSKFPETSEAWSTTEDSYYTNPSLETAKEYLAQSDYNNEEVVLLVPANPANGQDVATVIATVLQSIGLNVKLSVIANNIINDTQSDPEAFDLVMGMMAADDYGVVAIARLMSKDSYSNGQETLNFITDEELQSLISLVNTAEGHTDENVQALHELIIENAYGRGLFATSSHNVSRSTMTELCMSFKLKILPGGCVYEDNEF